MAKCSVGPVKFPASVLGKHQQLLGSIFSILTCNFEVALCRGGCKIFERGQPNTTIDIT